MNKKKQKLSLKSLRRWKKRVREEMRINRETPKNPSNSKCLVWRDLLLEGDINLGQICTKIDHTIPFDEADSFCKVIFSFNIHIKMADQKELIYVNKDFIYFHFISFTGGT